MSFATATFTAAGQSTLDNPNNPYVFPPGVVDITGSDAGSFSGTVQLRRSFQKPDGSWTAYEVVDSWTDADLPVTAEITYVPGTHFDLYCSACAAGSANFSIGRGA